LVLHFPLHHAAGFCFVLGCFLGLGPDFGLVSAALVGPAASVAVFGLADALVCLVVFQFMPPTVLFGFFPRFLSSPWVGIVLGGFFFFFYLPLHVFLLQ